MTISFVWNMDFSLPGETLDVLFLGKWICVLRKDSCRAYQHLLLMRSSENALCLLRLRIWEAGLSTTVVFFFFKSLCQVIPGAGAGWRLGISCLWMWSFCFLLHSPTVLAPSSCLTNWLLPPNSVWSWLVLFLFFIFSGVLKSWNHDGLQILHDQ